MTTTHLELIGAGSDKFYRVTDAVTPDGCRYVLAQWGRRGTAGQSQLQVPGDASQLIWSKRQKGYRNVLSVEAHEPVLAHVPGLAKSKPDPGWVTDVDAAFERAAGQSFDIGDDSGGPRCLVACDDFDRWEKTPGWPHGAGRRLLDAPHAKAGTTVVAELDAVQAAAAAGLGSYDCPMLSSASFPGACDVLDVIAGLVDVEPVDSVTNSGFARIVETASLLAGHRD